MTWSAVACIFVVAVDRVKRGHPPLGAVKAYPACYKVGMEEGGRKYRELDEVRAPEDLPQASVKADDRGVVVAELHNPDADPPRAIEVEYADEEGVPKAFVVYTPDLGHLLAVHPEH